MRARAKDKLFQLLGLQDQIDLVDGNFCILQNGLVTKLVNIPQQSNASFDLKAFTCLMSLLKEIDRNNLELLRNILLQLDVMMISSEVCQLVHDNHIWVYIMESLGASFIVSHQLVIIYLKYLFTY